ncbi:chitobiase/beta-hexosaminidase C-terminal domain-containing protein [Clostridium sp. DL1XJH146]
MKKTISILLSFVMLFTICINTKKVQAATDDVTPPELISVNVDAQEYQGSDTVTVTIEAKDDLSNINYIDLVFEDPDNSTWYPYHYAYDIQSTDNPNNFVSFTKINDTTYELKFKLNDYSEIGEWSLAIAHFVDGNRNEIEYCAYDSTELTSGNFNVTASFAQNDTEAPQLSNMSLSKNKYSIDETVEMSIEASDNLSGIKRISALFTKENGGPSICIEEMTKTSENEYKIESNLSYYENYLFGEYYLDTLFIEDEAGNVLVIEDNNTYIPYPSNYTVEKQDLRQYYLEVENVAFEGIYVESDYYEIEVNSSYPINSNNLPTGALNNTVTWVSENADIAEIDSEGILHGKGVGNTTITGTTADGKYTKTVEINVQWSDYETHLLDYSMQNNSLKGGDMLNIHLELSGVVEFGSIIFSNKDASNILALDFDYDKIHQDEENQTTSIDISEELSEYINMGLWEFEAIFINDSPEPAILREDLEADSTALDFDITDAKIDDEYPSLINIRTSSDIISTNEPFEIRTELKDTQSGVSNVTLWYTNSTHDEFYEIPLYYQGKNAEGNYLFEDYVTPNNSGYFAYQEGIYKLDSIEIEDYSGYKIIIENSEINEFMIMGYYEDFSDYGIEVKNVPVEGINVELKKFTIEKGSIIEINSNIISTIPSYATPNYFRYTVENEDIVKNYSIDDFTDGFYGVAIGSTKVTATTADGKFKEDFEIDVVNNYTAPNCLIEDSELELKEATTYENDLYISSLSFINNANLHVKGDLYVYGTLINQGNITVDGTLYVKAIYNEIPSEFNSADPQYHKCIYNNNGTVDASKINNNLNDFKIPYIIYNIEKITDNIIHIVGYTSLYTGLRIDNNFLYTGDDNNFEGYINIDDTTKINLEFYNFGELYQSVTIDLNNLNNLNNIGIDQYNPTASCDINSGTYTEPKEVSLTMSEEGTIYFTLDGSNPTTSSSKYTAAINISDSTTLKFIAIDKAGNKSKVYTNEYLIEKTTPTDADEQPDTPKDTIEDPEDNVQDTSKEVMLNKIKETPDNNPIALGDNSDEQASNIKALSNDNKIPEGTTLQISIKNTAKVSKDYFEAIKGKNINLSFEKEGIEWSFNGKDIDEKSLEAIKDLDLSLKPVETKVAEGIQSKVKEKTGKDTPVFAFSYNYDGALPGMCTVKVFVGKDWSGKTINVYRYYPDKDTYEIIEANVKVDSDGYMSYKTAHCSEYFIAETSSELPKTGSPIDFSLLLILGFTMLIGGVLFLIKKQNN